MARFTLGLLFAIRLLTPAAAGAHPLPAAVEGQDRQVASEAVAVAGPPSALPPAPLADVPAMISEAALRWGLDPQQMLRVAWCESKYDPGATSRGGHRGLFQFDRATWRERAPLVRITPDFAAAYSPAENVEVAAATMAAGQWWRWSCK